MSTIDPNTLASALPGGITYILGSGRDDWTARQIAEFQAERLAESGYRLTYVGDDEYAKATIAEIEGINGDKDGLP